METKVMLASSGSAKAGIATVIHEGQEFTALGSVLDPANGVAVGYVSSDGASLTTWKGEPIAPLERVSTWKVRSAFSSTMSAYRATIEGRQYHGRGFGPCMLLCMRAAK